MYLRLAASQKVSLVCSLKCREEGSADALPGDVGEQLRSFAVSSEFSKSQPLSNHLGSSRGRMENSGVVHLIAHLGLPL